MAQATSVAADFGYIYVNLTQLVTPGEGGRLDSMHHALNMGDQKIWVLQQTLTRHCNVVVTLEQKIHYLYQNVTDQPIKDSSNSSPRDDF